MPSPKRLHSSSEADFIRENRSLDVLLVRLARIAAEKLALDRKGVAKLGFA